MAAPSITTFSRNGLPTNTNVNYTLTYSAGSPSVTGVSPSADTFGSTYYSATTLSVSCNGNSTTSTSTCLHGARGKSELQTITAKLSWTSYTIKRTFHSGSWSSWYLYRTYSTEEEPVYPSDTDDTQYRLLGTSGAWRVEYRTYRESYYSYDWNPGVAGSTSEDFTFYAPPESFTFTNCTAGKTWLVSEGINKSLITNLTSFQAVAKRWKQWKNQTAQSACPSFDSPISAKRMDEIYQYMNIIGANESKFSTGEKVSAAMFNDLATKINTR